MTPCQCRAVDLIRTCSVFSMKVGINTLHDSMHQLFHQSAGGSVPSAGLGEFLDVFVIAIYYFIGFIGIDSV